MKQLLMHIRTIKLSLGLSVLLLSSTQAVGVEWEDMGWIEVTTPNFEIRSLRSETTTVKLAHYLEALRAAMPRVLNHPQSESPLPLGIYLFRMSERHVKTIGRGSARASLRDYTIILNDRPHHDVEWVPLLHSYMHYVTHTGTVQVPDWYDEGLAAYLSDVRINKGRLELGTAKYSGANSMLGMLPVADVLAREKHYDDWGRMNRFKSYVQSWGLIYYLRNESPRKDRIPQDLSDYVARVEIGMDESTAFEQTFGFNVETLGPKMRRFFKARKYNYYSFDLEKLVPDFQHQVRRLSREEVALGLGRLAIEHNPAKAKRLLGIAAKSPDTRAESEAALGVLYKVQQDFDQSLLHLQTALQLAPYDTNCHLDIADYWHDLADETGDADKRTERLEKAQSHYRRAMELDPFRVEAYAMYGHILSTRGHHEEAIPMLEKARRMLPTHLGNRMILAEAYAEVGRIPEAVQEAKSVRVWATEASEFAQRADTILQRFPKLANPPSLEAPRDFKVNSLTQDEP